MYVFYRHFTVLLFAVSFLLTGVCSAHEPNDTLLRGVDLYHKGEYEKALAVLNDGLAAAMEQSDSTCLILFYRNLGNVYSRIGSAVDALKAYQTSVRLAELVKDSNAQARSLMNIGALYEEQKDFPAAIAVYKEVSELARLMDDVALIADCANNNGVIYEQQNKYEDALKEYKAALEIYERIGNDERIGMALNNMGIVYKFLGDYPSSIQFYSRSLQLAEKIGNKFLAAANLTNMGNVYFLMKDYPKCIEYQQKSLTVARAINALYVVVEVYTSLADAYAAIGNYKMAYQFHQQYVALHDSLVNKEQLEQIAELQTRFETDKKEKEIEALKQSKDLQLLKINTQQLLLQRRNLQIIAISIIVVLAAVIGYLFYSRQQLKQKQLRERAVLDTEFRERVRIARDMHDDLGSGLSRISLAAELADRKEGVDADTQQHIRYIAQLSKELVDNMRDLVWILNPDHASLDQLAARIREFCGDYLEQSGITARFDMSEQFPGYTISRELQRNVFLTVKEAVHNIVKHARAQTVKISFAADLDNLNIKIADDGCGFDPEAIGSTGNGLRNMQQRIQLLNGTYQLQTSKDAGTSIEISIPISTNILVSDRKYMSV